MRYTALTVSGPVDIGEFPDQETAEAAAAENFGDALQAVILQQHDTVTVTAEPPISGLTLLAGLAVVVALSMPRRTNR
jgi:hypothetical protein